MTLEGFSSQNYSRSQWLQAPDSLMGKKKKSIKSRAQMWHSLQMKLHVENSFSPSFCGLKSLKNWSNWWLKLSNVFSWNIQSLLNECVRGWEFQSKETKSFKMEIVSWAQGKQFLERVPDFTEQINASEETYWKSL